MTMTPLDWIIVAVCATALTWFSLRTVKYLQGVGDFLSANRTAGRYAIALDASVVGVGAISAVGMFEQFYAAGFPTIWWAWMSIPAGMIITLSGWVYYRFRETRCMTLAQFFEVRYSRRFRIFTGIIIWLSGIVNFGIFPFVASNFFVYYCGLPAEFTLLGMTMPTYWPIMLITTGMSLAYTCIGGQITVLVTDCVQGMFVAVGLVVLAVFLLSQYGWSEVVESMNEAPKIAIVEKADMKVTAQRKAHEKAVEAASKSDQAKKAATEAEESLVKSEAARGELDDQAVLAEKASGQSMVNPFDTGKVKHFGLAFFLILVFNQFYGGFSWQGQSGYKSSALSPHEQKMGQVIFQFLYMIRLVGLVLLAVCALTFLTHANFATQATPAHEVLDGLKSTDTPQLAVQQRVSVALAYMLPTGLRGFFCVMMIFLLITTQDTYMHSWGTIFIQDVVMPIRKKPLTPKQHVNFLRCSIIGVAAFAIIFSAFYKPTEFIQMYFAITGAIIGGLGAAIIGGLYWKYGGTLAAYVAVGLGAILSVTRIVTKQFTTEISAISDKGPILRFVDYINTEVNSQTLMFWIIIICIASYIVLSLIRIRKPFNLNRMLHRGQYDAKGDHKEATDATKSKWAKIVGITAEFTRVDRVLALTMVGYNLIWAGLFFGAAVYNFLIAPIPTGFWTKFWQIWVYSQAMLGVPIALWFIVGGVRDIKRIFHRLVTLQRDDTDDGSVVKHHLPGEADEPGDVEADKAQ